MFEYNKYDSQGKEFFKRIFKRELNLQLQLKHESIPRITDYFIDDDLPFLVMELLEGENLQTLLDENKNEFLIDDIANWAIQVLEVLDYLHNLSNPIFHRDIKPSNLILSPRGKIKLLDFGIAKITEAISVGMKSTTTLVAATPSYAPIEQLIKSKSIEEIESYTEPGRSKLLEIYNQKTDASCDLYALGASIYHLITAFPTYSKTGKKISSLQRGLEVFWNKEDPLELPNQLNPNIPNSISDWILKAMAIERKDRFQSAVEMKNALEIALKNEITTPDPLPKPSPNITVPSSERQKLINRLKIANKKAIELGISPLDETNFADNSIIEFEESVKKIEKQILEIESQIGEQKRPILLKRLEILNKKAEKFQLNLEALNAQKSAKTSVEKSISEFENAVNLFEEWIDIYERGAIVAEKAKKLGLNYIFETEIFGYDNWVKWAEEKILEEEKLLGKDNAQAELLQRVKNIEAKAKKFGIVLPESVSLTEEIVQQLEKQVEESELLDSAVNEQFDYYYKIGMSSLTNENYSDAIQYLSKALEIKPDSSTALNNRGNAYFESGKYELALTDYERAVELSPNFKTAIQNKEKANEKLKSKKETNNVVEPNNNNAPQNNPNEKKDNFIRQEKIPQNLDGKVANEISSSDLPASLYTPLLQFLGGLFIKIILSLPMGFQFLAIPMLGTYLVSSVLEDFDFYRSFTNKLIEIGVIRDVKSVVITIYLICLFIWYRINVAIIGRVNFLAVLFILGLVNFGLLFVNLILCFIIFSFLGGYNIINYPKQVSLNEDPTTLFFALIMNVFEIILFFVWKRRKVIKQSQEVKV